jgi:GTP cyclohydrolase II
VFRALACPCRERLDAALERIGADGGVLIYLTRPIAPGAHAVAASGCPSDETRGDVNGVTDPYAPGQMELGRAILRELGVSQPFYLAMSHRL